MRTFVIVSLVAFATSAPAFAQSNNAGIMQSGALNNAIIQQSATAAPAPFIPTAVPAPSAPQPKAEPKKIKKKKKDAVAVLKGMSSEHEGQPASDGNRH